MTPLEVVLAVLSGLAAGVLSGLFGIGGGTVMTPAVQALLGAPPIIALATPLPAIFPTALTGAWTYRQGGQLDVRAAAWIVGPGIAGAVAGAALTDVIPTHLLLIVTALLLAREAVGILRGASRREAAGEPSQGTPLQLAAIGLAAGSASGLLGIGGGIVIVPLLVGVLRMPLKRALGTSLLAIVALVIPGTVVHSALGHIDWAIFAALTVGAVPGARIGARLALGTRERTLRLLVGSFLLVVALAYGAGEVVHLVRGT
jgi:uncharacterized membrane protein YfcA